VLILRGVMREYLIYNSEMIINELEVSAPHYFLIFILDVSVWA